MKYLMILLILAISFSSALTANFDCPEEVTQNTEFSCMLEITDADGVYDFKLDLQKNSENIARVYNQEKDSFQSSFYYLKGFIEAGTTKGVKVIIEEFGNLEGLVKLRRASSTEQFNFSINVLKNENTPTEDTSDKNPNSNSNEGGNEEAEIVKRSSNSLNKTEELNNIVTGAIVLNSAKSLNMGEERVLVYESKNSKIIKYLSYAFSFFLIILIFFLIRERF